MASEAPQPMIRVPALDATITAARVIRVVASQPSMSAMGNSGDCGHARQPGGGESVPPEYRPPDGSQLSSPCSSSAS
jgi:hypothetical protein